MKVSADPVKLRALATEIDSIASKVSRLTSDTDDAFTLSSLAGSDVGSVAFAIIQRGLDNAAGVSSAASKKLHHDGSVAAGRALKFDLADSKIAPQNAQEWILFGTTGVDSLIESLMRSGVNYAFVNGALVKLGGAAAAPRGLLGFLASGKGLFLLSAAGDFADGMLNGGRSPIDAAGHSMAVGAGAMVGGTVGAALGAALGGCCGPAAPFMAPFLSFAGRWAGAYLGGKVGGFLYDHAGEIVSHIGDGIAGAAHGVVGALEDLNPF